VLDPEPPAVGYPFGFMARRQAKTLSVLAIKTVTTNLERHLAMSTNDDTLYTTFLLQVHAQHLMTVLQRRSTNFQDVKDALYRFRQLSDSDAAEVMEVIAGWTEIEGMYDADDAEES
jgi:hypothetical protein